MIKYKSYFLCDECERLSELKDFEHIINAGPHLPDEWVCLPCEEGEVMRHLCPFCAQNQKEDAQTKKEALRLLSFIFDPAFFGEVKKKLEKGDSLETP